VARYVKMDAMHLQRYCPKHGARIACHRYHIDVDIDVDVGADADF
jgi:hypothetical protein